jgi:hypothetical protein
LKVPLWRLVNGPEWEQSLADADPDDEYFRRNVETVREAMAYDQFFESQPFTDEDTRVFTTKDVAAGYRLVALVRVDRSKRTVELGWAMLEWL